MPIPEHYYHFFPLDKANSSEPLEAYDISSHITRYIDSLEKLQRLSDISLYSDMSLYKELTQSALSPQKIRVIDPETFNKAFKKHNWRQEKIDRILATIIKNLILLYQRRNVHIAFEIPEIYWAEKSEPAYNFSKNIKQITTLAEYQKETSKPSYLLAWGFISFARTASSMGANKPLPSTTFKSFDSLQLPMIGSNLGNGFSKPNHLTFGPSVHVFDFLRNFSSICKPYRSDNPSTFVFYGEHYADEHIIEKAHQKLIKALKHSKYTYYIYIYLVSNLEDLKKISDIIGKDPIDLPGVHKLHSLETMAITHKNFQDLHALLYRPKQYRLTAEPTTESNAYILCPDTNVQKYHRNNKKNGLSVAPLSQVISHQVTLNLSTHQQQNHDMQQQVARQTDLRNTHAFDMQNTNQFSVNRREFWIDWVPLESSLNERLLKKAKQFLLNHPPNLNAKTFKTAFYQKNHSEWTFWTNIQEDERFRSQFVKRICRSVSLTDYKNELCDPDISGNASETAVETLFSQKIQLTNPYFFAFDNAFVKDLCRSSGPYYLQDGINPKQCILNKLVMLIPNFVVGYQPSLSSYLHLESTISSLSYHQLSRSRDPSTWLSSACLVRNDTLKKLSNQERQSIIFITEKLLAIFHSESSLCESELIELETLYIHLIEFYFPKHPEFHCLIRKLFACFDEHHSDYIKTLLFINLHGHTTYLTRFFELLAMLDDRALLPTFYSVFIKYATDLFSIVSLLYKAPGRSVRCFIDQTESNSKQTMLDDLLKHTPVVKHAQEWPALIQFYNGSFIFFAKNNIFFPYRNVFNHFSHYWEDKLTHLLETHLQDKALTDQLIEHLLNQLVSETDGLRVQPLKLYETLFINLKKILKNAIKHHCLQEQIMEISDLSFRWNDVPYALLNDDFKVISKEMEVVEYKLNPFTARYYVSEEELKAFIFSPPTGPVSNKASIFLTGVNFSYKTAAFRYLGGISLREPIAYYRQLYHSLTHRTDDPEERALRAQIFSFYLLNSTGLSFRRPFDQAAFNKQFITLFSEKIEFCFEDGEKKALLLHVDALLEDFANTVEVFEYAPANPFMAERHTLWLLWRDELYLKPGDALPNCLTRTFSARDICKYVYTHQEALCSFFKDTNLEPSACLNLLIQFIAQNELENETTQWFIQQCTTLLAIQYPDCTMQSFLQNIFEIERFIKAYAKQILPIQIDPFFDDLYALCSNTDIRDLSGLLETLTNTPGQHCKAKDAVILHTVLLTLINQSEFLQKDLPNATQYVRNFLQLELRLDIKLEIVKPIFQLLEKCSVQNEKITRFKTLLDLSQTPQGRAFLLEINQLAQNHIHAVLRLLSHFNHSSRLVSFFAVFIKDNPHENFEQMVQPLETLSQTHLNELLLFHQWIVEETTVDVDESCLIKKLCHVEESVLRKLSKMRDFIALSPEKIIKHLFSETLPHKIIVWQNQHVALNQNRFNTPVQDTTNKIAEMAFKTRDHAGLSESLKESLLIDYQNLMSYMTVNPVLTKALQDGTRNTFTISQLQNEDFKGLFSHLCKKIQHSSTAKAHQYQIMLLALGCEAMYRTVGQFPRNTQLLCLLMTLRHPGHLIHEVQTGEGKSIIAAMHALLLAAQGHRVDICTENDELANNAIQKFSDFYQFFQISIYKEVLKPVTPYKTYTQHTVTYSTPSNLSLFQLNIQLEKKQLPGNRVILADEVDAALTSPVEFRLSGVLKPEFYDTTAWQFIFITLLDFVQNDELFLNNYCNANDDLHNFRLFCHKNGANQGQKNLLKALDDKRLEKLIQSAMQARHLIKNTNFYLVKKESDQQCVNYAAPIMDDTKRPNPAVNYGEFVQELLHAFLTKKTGATFQAPQMAESIVSMSARNFFHNYKRIIGFTGTSGAANERAEFQDEYGLSVMTYPSFKPSRRTNLGLYVTENVLHQQQRLLALMNDAKEQNMEQPVLIICESPKIVHKFCKFFKHQKPDWDIQSYDGYEHQGILESDIVARAGKNNVITIATLSMTRGADVQPEHPDGVFVINTCTEISESELRQIFGRAGRNGDKGLVCSVLTHPIFKGFNTDAEYHAIYLQNQKDISQKRIQQRAEKRLLQDLLYYFNQQFFTLRQKVDTLLEKPYGLGTGLVSTRDFMEVLANFNGDTEDLYKAHLSGTLSMDELIQSRINDYNRLITTWFDKAPTQLDACEPAVPIDIFVQTKALYTYQIQDILPYSQLGSNLWQHFGYQAMTVGFEFSDTVVEAIKPYLNSEKSLLNTLVDFAETHQLLDHKSLLSAISDLRKNSDLFFEEVMRVVGSYRLIGRVLPIQKIKQWFESYLDHVKTCVEKKEWDRLSLPEFNFSTLKRMLSLYNGASTLLGIAGGPIHFLIQRIVVPAIKSLLKRVFHHSESTLIQVLIGLDDIESHLSQCLNAIYELHDSNNLTLREFVGKLLPMLENQAFRNLLKQGLKLMNLEAYQIYVDALPELLSKLEPYYNYKLRILLKPKNIFKVFLTALELPLVRQNFDALKLGFFVQQLLNLNSTKSERLLGKLSLIEAIEFFKLLMHPQFNKLLVQLPQEMPLADLARFLKHDHLSGASQDLSNAFKTFNEYQNNRARVTANLNKAYLKLQKSTLTAEAVNQALAHNHSPIVNLSEPMRSKTDKSFNPDFYFHFGKALATALVVTYTVFCFSYLLLFASAVALSVTVLGIAKDLMKQQKTTKASDEFIMQQPAKPIDVIQSGNEPVLETHQNTNKSPELREIQDRTHPAPPEKAHIPTRSQVTRVGLSIFADRTLKRIHNKTSHYALFSKPHLQKSKRPNSHDSRPFGDSDNRVRSIGSRPKLFQPPHDREAAPQSALKIDINAP